MKKIRKIISGWLVSCFVVTVFFSLFVPLYANAEEVPEYDTIYYSDLFYGYSTSYLLNNKFEQYSNNTDDITRDIFNDYINSPNFVWTEIQTGISAALDIKEFLQLMSDAYLETNFTYENAIDSANIIFAKNLIDETNVVKNVGSAGKIAKNAKKLLTLYTEFEENFDIYAEDSVVIEEFFMTLSEEGVFYNIGTYELTVIQEIILPKLDGLKDAVSGTAKTLEVAKALATGLMLEDIRLEMLDDIIRNSENHETVYTGISRLRTQLSSGFASYFAHNYINDSVINKLSSAVQDAIVGSSSAYGFVSACLEVASWVVFDVLFDVPDLDDMMTQMVLREYSDGLSLILRTKADAFNRQFSSKDISVFESIFEGYLAATNASLDASEAISLPANKANLKNVQAIYKDFTYENYIHNVIDSLQSVTYNERKLKELGTWIFSTSTNFKMATDTIQDNSVYLFNGCFDGDVVISSGSVTLSDDTIIKGNIEISYGSSLIAATGSSYIVDGEINVYGGSHSYDQGKVIVESGATLTVTGNTTIGNGTFPYGVLENHGTFVSKGDFKTVGAGNYSTVIEQSDDNAKLIFGGDVILSRDYNSFITGGTVVFNGTDQQIISEAALKAYNIEVLNKNGVKGTVQLYGNLDLHGNSIDGSIYMYDGATLTEGSYYEQIYIQGIVNLQSNIKGNVDVSYGHSLVVSVGTSYTIDGNLNVYGGSHSYDQGKVIVESGATLTVTGNTTIGNGTFPYGVLENHGTFVSKGDFKTVGAGNYSTVIEQSDDDAKLVFGRDVILSRDYNSFITGGTVVFNGTDQQVISEAALKAYNIEVLNKNGIKGTVQLYGNLDLHGNSIDGSIYMYDGSTLAEGSDYGQIYIQDTVNLRSNICGNVEVSTGSNLIIASKSTYVIDGNLIIAGRNAGANIESDASLTVTGDISVGGPLSFRGTLRNDGTLICDGNLETTNNQYSFITQSTKDAKLYIRGNVKLASTQTSNITGGIVIFDGTTQQSVTNLKAPIIVLNNSSSEGTKFLTGIHPNILFNHNRNQYTLKGTSSFVDYDLDGLLDNEDTYALDPAHKLTFVDENNVIIDERLLHYGEVVDAPSDPLKEGYTFNGWIPELPKTMPDIDLWVVAQWKQIESEEHKHSLIVIPGKNATCIEDGLSEGQQCSVCGVIIAEQEIIPSKGHSWDNGIQTIVPTEENPGILTYTCIVCDATKTETIPALGHVHKYNSIVVAPTCVDQGYTEYTCICGNTYLDAYVNALGHIEEFVAGKAATCIEQGLSDGKKCTVCGVVIEEQKTIPKLNHQEKILPAKTATCVTTGLTEGKQCSICNTITVAQKTTDKLAHNQDITVKGMAATCNKDGKTDGKKCSVCGTVTVKQTTIKATGKHVYDDKYDAKCNVCGHTRQAVESVPMYRMYDPNSSEHFYTGSTEERDILVAAGWNYEGVGFNFPKAGSPVHRLYEPKTGEHLYTMDENEKKTLLAAGWNYEGVAFNSADPDDVPQYRLHNPNATRGAYHFTSSTVERDMLMSIGWELQGIGWYSCLK